MAGNTDRIAAYQIVLASVVAVALGIGLIYLAVADISDPTIRDVILSVGAAVISAGMVGFVTDFVLRRALVDVVANRMEVRKQLLDSGILALFRRRVEVDLAELIEKANKYIFIHGMTARSVVMNVYTSLQKAAERGITVEILIAEEESQATKIRELEEKGANIFRTEVDDVIRKGGNLIDSVQKNKSRVKVEIRTHGRLPTCSLYIIDDTILYTPYFFSMTGPETPVLMLDAKAPASPLVSALWHHKRGLWLDARVRVSSKTRGTESRLENKKEPPASIGIAPGSLGPNEAQ